MEVRKWEQQSSEIALYETHRQLESQRLQQHRAKQWADQAHGEKVSLCGELDMRNKLFQERRTKDWPRNCRILKTLLVRRKRSSSKSKIRRTVLQQLRAPHTVSQLLTQTLELQDRANSLSDASDCHDPETASSSGASHVLTQHQFQDGALPRFWTADTRNHTGTSRNVIERLRAREAAPLNSLRTFKESGILLSRIDTRNYRANNDTRDEDVT